MTVCIAAIADKNKVVAVTDKMLTHSAGFSTKFESSENRKHALVGTNVLILYAGDVLQGGEIIAELKRHFSGMNQPKVQKVAEELKDIYYHYWTAQLEGNLLSRYQIPTIRHFKENERSYSQEFTNNINNIIGQYNLDVAFIVAGIDARNENNEAHVYTITSPGGIVKNHDAIGYAIIGSGSIHAQLCMVENKVHPCLTINRAIYNLIDAKKRSEFDPGVGSLTDIITICSDIKIYEEAETQVVLQKYNECQTAITDIIESHVINML